MFGFAGQKVVHYLALDTMGCTAMMLLLLEDICVYFQESMYSSVCLPAGGRISWWPAFVIFKHDKTMKMMRICFIFDCRRTKCGVTAYMNIRSGLAGGAETAFRHFYSLLSQSSAQFPIPDMEGIAAKWKGTSCALFTYFQSHCSQKHVQTAVKWRYTSWALYATIEFAFQITSTQKHGTGQILDINSFAIFWHENFGYNCINLLTFYVDMASRHYNSGSHYARR